MFSSEDIWKFKLWNEQHILIFSIFPITVCWTGYAEILVNLGKVKSHNAYQIWNNFDNFKCNNKLKLLESWYIHLLEGKHCKIIHELLNYCKLGFSSLFLLFCLFVCFCHLLGNTFMILCFIWSYKVSCKLVMWRLLYKLAIIN